VLPIVTGVDIAEWLAGFEGESLALALGDDTSLYARPLAGALALVVGNEGAGLSESMLQLATQQITIPMHNNVESLNAAAATAICLFEAVRQRHAAGR
jgi:TrmH family RNA methyltransferase